MFGDEVPITDARFDRVVLALAERGYAPASTVALVYRPHCGGLREDDYSFYYQPAAYRYAIYTTQQREVHAATFPVLVRRIATMPLAQQYGARGWVEFDPATMDVLDDGRFRYRGAAT